MKNFKFGFKPVRTLAMMIGSFMFISGVKDFLPQLGSVGYIGAGIFLMWWGGWRHE